VLALLRDEVLRCRGANDLSAARTDVLARARYEDGELMPVDDVVDELVTLLVGGHETTANTLAWTLYHLLAHPAALERARDESRAGAAARAEGVPFLDAAIKESMRLTPIAPAVSRNLRRPLRLGAYDVPAGTILWPCVYTSPSPPGGLAGAVALPPGALPGAHPGALRVPALRRWP
jgi:cytochrome P450